MNQSSNPALNGWLEAMGETWVWCEVSIRRIPQAPEGFELRHADDAGLGQTHLEALLVDELREMAQTTINGVFRPIKAAPTLRRGWICRLNGIGELWRAMQALYPGSVADWHWVNRGPATTTDYREFTRGQTGMYRITTQLDDQRVAQVIAACCNSGFCLKRRLWQGGGLAIDSAETKSAIPCLEPCAVLMELARKAARIDQEDPVPFAINVSESKVIAEALRFFADQGAVGIREADLDAAANPRMARLVLERFLSRGLTQTTHEKE